jgi:integration host factor subunit alpha
MAFRNQETPSQTRKYRGCNGKRQGLQINYSTQDDAEAAVSNAALSSTQYRETAKAESHQGSEQNLPTLTKAELAELLFEQVGLNKREAKDMVETFFNEISNVLEHGEAVKLSGFGNFLLRDKSERPGRNPKTGEEVLISARRVVTFQASAKLKEMVDEDRSQNNSD